MSTEELWREFERRIRQLDQRGTPLHDGGAHDEVAAAHAEIEQATELLRQATARLERTLEAPAQLSRGERFERAALGPTSPAPTAPPSEHRRMHRPGHPPKTDSDPEVQAFIRARVDRMTFQEITEEIAHHFPEARRVRKSAIHTWWQRTRDRPG